MRVLRIRGSGFLALFQLIEVPTAAPTEITVQATAVSPDVQSNAASITIVVNTPAASRAGSLPEITQNEPSECRVTEHPGSEILAQRYTVSETEIVVGFARALPSVMSPLTY